ncbi:hypothetical protein [Phaeodactylibacter luteus]|nr:hypothetical protein [Phaeodactylibacter luteus]
MLIVLNGTEGAGQWQNYTRKRCLSKLAVPAQEGVLVRLMKT